MSIPIQYEEDQLPQALCTFRRRPYCTASTRIPFTLYPNPTTCHYTKWAALAAV